MFFNIGNCAGDNGLLTERDAMSRIARYGSLDKAVVAFPPVILLTANGDT